MDSFNYYSDAFKKYAIFSGRASRAEYWYFFLFNIIASIVIGIIGSVIKMQFLGSLYSLVVILPSLAIASRRLHDIGKSFWWILISLIPFIGAIWLIVLLATKGNIGDNKYGPESVAAKQI